MSGGGGCSRVNVRRGVAWVWFGLVRLFAKFKTSRMFPSGIFWCGCSCSCCSCDRGKTKSTPSPRLKSGLGTGVWQYFLFITESRTQTHRITQEGSRVPMSTQEHPWATMSNHEHSWALLGMVQKHYEWYWRNAHECLSALMSAVCAMAPCLWLLMVAYKCSWVLKSCHGPSLVLMATCGHTHECL